MALSLYSTLKFCALCANKSVLNCGLYYKHITIVNDDSSIVNKLETSLIDDATVIIYDCHMFMVQATGLNGAACFFYIFIDYRGHHRKGVSIYNAT
jgi:hypothetical protein